jgi:WD repeat-containing protein 68
MRRVGQAKQELLAPLTSFDWNINDPNMCVTCSIDTTCTVWDMETLQAKTQLIAHDSEVHDVAFGKGTNTFASVGADGSMRLFDLRSLAHSTILFETSAVKDVEGEASKNPSLLRMCWNQLDNNYLAAIQQDSHDIFILDLRVPAVPVFELKAHASNVSAIAWAPNSSVHLCSSG